MKKSSKSIDLSGFLREWDAICVLGPTASGKTKFAVELALQSGKWEGKEFVLGAEILSADSRQIYKAMDIGTGKDLADYSVEIKNPQIDELCRVDIPYHLMDIKEAGEKYNIFEYQRDFAKAYREVIERGNIPIICGGSGLYIEAATKGYLLKEVKPDEKLRSELEQKPMDELVEMLTKYKLARGETPHNKSDFDSKKRLIRAIEIEVHSAKESAKVSAIESATEADSIQSVSKDIFEVSEQNNLLLPKKCRYIGINVDREVRNARIDARLEARIKEGMVDEVQKILDSGVAPEDLIYYGLEYKFVTQYIMGEFTLEVMQEKLAIAIHQFAKRQMTWFRGMERKGVQIEWV